MVSGEDRGAEFGEPVVHMADVGAVLREKLGDGDLTAVAVRCVECCSDFLAQTIFCECMRVVRCIRYDRVAVLTQRGDFEFKHGVLAAGLFIVVVEECDFHELCNGAGSGGRQLVVVGVEYVSGEAVAQLDARDGTLLVQALTESLQLMCQSIGVS